MAAYNPDNDFQAADINLAAQNQTALTILQRRALNAVGWTDTNYLEHLIVGPAGSGKSTQALRLLPRNSCIVAATNERRVELEQRYPEHTVMTHDQALGNLHRVQRCAAVLIDEVYLLPHLYVVGLCQIGLPVLATGDPGQGSYNGPLGRAFDHTRIAVDHVTVMQDIHRYGPDAVALMNRDIAPIYRAAFGLANGWVFNAAGPQVALFQNALVDRPCLKLTAHVANTGRLPNMITVASSQGREKDHVLLYVIPADLPYFRANPTMLALAVSRARQSFSLVTDDRQPRLEQWAIANNLTLLDLPPPPAQPAPNTIFGSYENALNHPAADTFGAEPAIPAPVVDDYARPTHVLHLLEDYRAEVADQAQVNMPADIAQAVTLLAPEPPSPAAMFDGKDYHFTGVGKGVSLKTEWPTPPSETYEPTIIPHIGYPFTNDDVASAIFAITDRYVKEQTVTFSYDQAVALATDMFGFWTSCTLQPEFHASLPAPAEMVGNWLSQRNAFQIAQIARACDLADTSSVTLAKFFLKKQAKPKFAMFGFQIEAGQGILATDKLMNLGSCPFIVAATKVCQAMLKPNIIYDSGYTPAELDTAIRAVLPPGQYKSMSVDLTQQDSSHTLVHRLFICMVLHLLGFTDEAIGLYLASRSRRTVLGLKLKVLFDVVERLFSGEAGTAFFNWLHSGGTICMTHQVEKARLRVGKGDDISLVPAVPRRVLAIDVLRTTGVIQKVDIFDHIDFANRIWTTSLRSFADPARMLSKYTCRLTDRSNTENEYVAVVDQDFTPTDRELMEVANAVAQKHRIDPTTAYTITEAFASLRDRATYMSLLRPSKVVATDMPLVRHCCGNEIVFEDRRDRCAPEALAFLVDVPVEAIIGELSYLRRGVNPCAAHDAASAHPRPRHMTHSEIVTIASRFNASTVKPHHGLRLHFCRGHVSVVRSHVSNVHRKPDAFDVFGSAPSFIRHGAGIASASLSFPGTSLGSNIAFRGKVRSDGIFMGAIDSVLAKPQAFEPLYVLPPSLWLRLSKYAVRASMYLWLLSSIYLSLCTIFSFYLDFSLHSPFLLPFQLFIDSVSFAFHFNFSTTLIGCLPVFLLWLYGRRFFPRFADFIYMYCISVGIVVLWHFAGGLFGLRVQQRVVDVRLFMPTNVSAVTDFIGVLLATRVLHVATLAGRTFGSLHKSRATRPALTAAQLAARADISRPLLVALERPNVNGFKFCVQDYVDAGANSHDALIFCSAVFPTAAPTAPEPMIAPVATHRGHVTTTAERLYFAFKLDTSALRLSNSTRITLALALWAIGAGHVAALWALVAHIVLRTLTFRLPQIPSVNMPHRFIVCALQACTRASPVRHYVVCLARRYAVDVLFSLEYIRPGSSLEYALACIGCLLFSQNTFVAPAGLLDHLYRPLRLLPFPARLLITWTYGDDDDEDDSISIADSHDSMTCDCCHIRGEAIELPLPTIDVLDARPPPAPPSFGQVGEALLLVAMLDRLFSTNRRAIAAPPPFMYFGEMLPPMPVPNTVFDQPVGIRMRVFNYDHMPLTTRADDDIDNSAITQEIRSIRPLTRLDMSPNPIPRASLVAFNQYADSTGRARAREGRAPNVLDVLIKGVPASGKTTLARSLYPSGCTVLTHSATFKAQWTDAGFRGMTPHDIMTAIHTDRRLGPVIIDEVYLMPHWLVRIVAGFSTLCIAIGDPEQYRLRAFPTPYPAADAFNDRTIFIRRTFERHVSFTVLVEVIDALKHLHLEYHNTHLALPRCFYGNWRTLGRNVETRPHTQRSVAIVHSVPENFDVVLAPSAGQANLLSLVYDIPQHIPVRFAYTSQGSRWERVAVYIDAAQLLDPSNDYDLAYFTVALTRATHDVVLYCPDAPVLPNTAGLFNLITHAAPRFPAPAYHDWRL